MRRRGVHAGLLIQLLLLVSSAVWSGSAAAQPVRGPHQTVDSRYSTTRPNAATGTYFSATYHAAGNPNASPPYMRRMIAWPPQGFRYDMSVPARCTASDIELEVRGPAACPAASRVGGGITQGRLFGSFGGPLKVVIFNNTNEQIFLVGSAGLASVSRGHVRRDQSIEFASPTCYPSFDPPGCPIDNALQLGTTVTVPRYTKSVRGTVRSYLTTPPRCPAAGYWKTPIRFWWADGSADTVVTKQACTRPRP
jgi:hypothetical protein